MSEEELTKKVKENMEVCPYCSCSDTTIGDVYELTLLSVEVTCHDCDSSWYEHYKFVSASPSH